MITSYRDKTFRNATVSDLIPGVEVTWRRSKFFTGQVQRIDKVLNQPLEFVIRWNHSNSQITYDEKQIHKFMIELKLPTEDTYGID